jgi:hypothetical protein
MTPAGCTSHHHDRAGRLIKSIKRLPAPSFIAGAKPVWRFWRYMESAYRRNHLIRTDRGSE